MKTSLFNLHELVIDDKILSMEFYAGDIFDGYSDILLLSAFKGDFSPVPNTTWEGLYTRLDLDFRNDELISEERISQNILSFKTPKNEYFEKLVAVEMADYYKRSNFTKTTLIARYRELGSFLEKFPSENDESISIVLLGTGSQGFSYDEAITELFKTIFQIKATNLRTIRVFANTFESIGIINLKINELLNRTALTHTGLLDAALEELNELSKASLSEFSKIYIHEIQEFSKSENSSLDTFGLIGRLFAERVSEKILNIYKKIPSDFRLESMLYKLKNCLYDERHLYIYSYLRLLQSYGNQTVHPNNPKLNHQDVAAIIIAFVRIIDFFEHKNNEVIKNKVH